MIGRKIATAAAMIGLGVSLAGCSLLGGDTTAQPEFVGAELEAQCRQVVQATDVINSEITRQFETLDDAGWTTGAGVRAMLASLEVGELTAPVQKAVDDLKGQYETIAEQLDTHKPDPAVIETAGNSIIEYSSALSLACQ